MSGMGLLQLTAPGCQPILDWDVPGFPACRAVNDHIIAVIEKLRPGRVILSSRWLGVDQEDKVIATILNAGRNQHGEPVIRFESTVLEFV